MDRVVDSNFIKFSHNIRVLFVQDLECVKCGTLDTLNIFFSNIDTVSSYKEAYNHFLANKYDLVIMSLNAPEENGIKIISKIRDISKSITILVISSNTNKFNFAELIDLGVDGYINRPVEIKQFSEVVIKTIEKLKNKQELYEYRVLLEEKVEKQVASLREKDKILSYQSKLAAMGEMIDAIAHQWKQPLNIVNMKIDMLRYDYKDGFVDERYCEELYNQVKAQITHMQDTLDEFRSFLRPDKESELFSVSDVIEKVLLLVKDELVKFNIKVEKNVKDDFVIDGIKNEIKHIFLNLISNSKDAFEEKNIQNRQIGFLLYKNDNGDKVIEVADNAGGIPKEVIDSVFDANMTTKEEGKGTGIGLYMSRQIVKKHGGEIFAENIPGGTKFIIKFAKDQIFN